VLESCMTVQLLFLISRSYVARVCTSFADGVAVEPCRNSQLIASVQLNPAPRPCPPFRSRICAPWGRCLSSSARPFSNIQLIVDADRENLDIPNPPIVILAGEWKTRCQSLGDRRRLRVRGNVVILQWAKESATINKTIAIPAPASTRYVRDLPMAPDPADWRVRDLYRVRARRTTPTAITSIPVTKKTSWFGSPIRCPLSRVPSSNFQTTCQILLNGSRVHPTYRTASARNRPRVQLRTKRHHP
jgi:hypothetical protein